MIGLNVDTEMAGAHVDIEVGVIRLVGSQIHH
ncbi:hypothetical protein HCH_04678 [Hahella chejuensis KCTC 2396]|uniref:Uncharacterized protein n=1 Tax=Hahella chejuensis (strain KCTC 2396) TaxID=349521 RepID=Q2SD97_HAHCH|nr:hypothetical protein HCH_04678 [Hahella chejuensis KCTC 2396]